MGSTVWVLADGCLFQLFLEITRKEEREKKKKNRAKGCFQSVVWPFGNVRKKQ